MTEHNDVIEFSRYDYIVFFEIILVSMVFFISSILAILGVTLVKSNTIMKRKRDLDAAALAIHLLCFFTFGLFMFYNFNKEATLKDSFSWKNSKSLWVRYGVKISLVIFFVLAFLVIIFKSIALHTQDLQMGPQDPTLIVVPPEKICAYMADQKCGNNSPNPLPDWECYGIKAKRCMDSGGLMFDGLEIPSETIEKLSKTVKKSFFFWKERKKK